MRPVFAPELFSDPSPGTESPQPDAAPASGCWGAGLLILDNLRVHHSKIVKTWLEENGEKIAVFYLPSYSPELNPDEYLNGDLKHCIRSGLPARTEKALTKKTRSFMRKLQNRPKHVSNYFKHPKIAYAA